MNFYQCPNVGTMEMSEGAPWSFSVSEERLAEVRAMPKPRRRLWALRQDTQWNVYSAIRCLDPRRRLSKDNPAQGVRAFVADYDMKMDLDTVQQMVEQMPAKFQPQKIEVSLSKKIRLVWMFEREVMVVNTDHAGEFLREFAKVTNAAVVLPGYDKASEKPQQIWTNGAEWYDFNPNPVPWSALLGMMVKLGGNDKLFGVSDIPIERVADEVNSRWPNRWQGPFEVDATGVRFWDPAADNPTGCQVKPDGMLCFTGPVPFKSWYEILGREWMDEQTVLHLGQGAENIFYDGKTYYENFIREGDKDPRWWDTPQENIKLRLRNRGISDRVPRGRLVSDLDRVMDYIQTHNRISGCAPLVNHPPGIVEVNNKRLLNISQLDHFKPAVDIMIPDPERDFPWIWKFINNFFVERGNHPVRPMHYYLAWHKRALVAFNTYKRKPGQALFFTGPADNGKTLFLLRIIAPTFGTVTSNPYQAWTGDTTFNEEMFDAYLWMINDEEAPKNEAARAKFIAKLKSAVVNPVHTYSPKYLRKQVVEWVGRFCCSLNDDPSSIGTIPEPVQSLMDKMMIFATQRPVDVFPEDVEDIIAKELPYFVRWLLDVYQPPQEILALNRMGVKSYFDPIILDYCMQQTAAFNLVELIRAWAQHTGYFDVDDKGIRKEEWVGTPTDLLAHFSSADTMAPLLKDWNVPKISKCLTALSRLSSSGVELAYTDDSRIFKIKHSIMLLSHG